MKELQPEEIARKICLLRGQKAMLDSDLAKFYGVTAGRLNEAVRRNRNRFPFDFMFQLSQHEWNLLRDPSSISNLKSQFAISSWGGRRHPPLVFTEQGVAMLSSVLRSQRAIQVNIAIMRAFVRLRHILASNRDLAKRIEKLERRIGAHDTDIQLILTDIHALMKKQDPRLEKKLPPIGFKEEVP